MEQTKEIYIYGISGHGQVVADIATACGYTIAGWIDDGINTSPDWETFIQIHPSSAIVLGVGNNLIRAQLAKKILQNGYTLPALIHPSAVISPSAIIAQGAVVMPLCVVNAHANIEQGVIINSGAIIEHDCMIGEFAHISPNVALAGGVSIGAMSHVGIGSSVIQNITIGKNSIIGAGSVVIHNIPDECTAIGVPCKPIYPE